jgi:hypothetical protein
MLGVAAKLIERIRLKVSKIRMLAQHRQFAARSSTSITRLVLRHASRLQRQNRRGSPPSVVNAGCLFNRKAPGWPRSGVEKPRAAPESTAEAIFEIATEPTEQLLIAFHPVTDQNVGSTNQSPRSCSRQHADGQESVKLNGSSFCTREKSEARRNACP